MMSNAVLSLHSTKNAMCDRDAAQIDCGDAQQTFALAENDRLVVPQSLCAESFIATQVSNILANEYDHEGSNPQFSVQHQQLEEEINIVLSTLRAQEWKRSRTLIANNFQHAFHTWKAAQTLQQERFKSAPPLHLPKILNQTITCKIVKRFSAKIPHMDTFELPSELNYDSEDEQDTDDDDSALKGKPKIIQDKSGMRKMFTPRNLDLPKDRARIRYKIVVNNETWMHLLSHSDDAYFEDTQQRKRVFTCVIPKIQGIPRSCTWIHINCCVHAEDEKILRALPYFGDDDHTGVDVSEFEKVPGELEPEIIGEGEELAVCFVVDRYKEVHCKNFDIYSALENCLGISVSEIQKAHERIIEGDWYRKTIITQHKGIEDRFANRVESRRITADDCGGDTALVSLVSSDVPSIDVDLPVNQRAGLGVGLGISNIADYETLNGNFRDFFCRRCYRYVCPLHSIMHPMPMNRVDPKPPVVPRYVKVSLPTDYVRENRRAQPLGLCNPAELTVRHGDLLQALLDKSKDKNAGLFAVAPRVVDKRHVAVPPSPEQVLSRTENAPTADETEHEAVVVDFPTGSLFHSARPSERRIDADRFHFSNGVIVFQNPASQRNEVFDLHSSLVEYPTLLHCVATRNALRSPFKKAPSLDAQNKHDSEETESQSPTEEELIERVITSLSHDSAQRQEAKQKATQQSSWSIESVFKEKLSAAEALRDAHADRDDSAPLDAKTHIQRSFTPSLTDVEIALAGRLCVMFREHQAMARAAQRDDEEEPLVAFACRLLASRSAEEVRRILQHGAVLFSHADDAPLLAAQTEPKETSVASENGESDEDDAIELHSEESENDIEEEVEEEEEEEEEVVFLEPTTKPSVAKPFNREVIDLTSDCENNENENENEDKDSNGNKDDNDCEDEDVLLIEESASKRVRIDDVAVAVTTAVTIPRPTPHKKKEHKGKKRGRKPSASTPAADTVVLPKLPTNSFKNEYKPCQHEGPCSRATDCSCYHRGTFCEKYCACGDDCRFRFPGCVCKGGCKTKSCPCFAASRVCDPDLCGDCGASIPTVFRPFLDKFLEAKRNNLCFSAESVATAATVAADEANFRLCTNLALQQRPLKKMYVGRSLIHGWGAFAGEFFERNEYICEYTGEVISQEEADRRGNVYDKINMSYLFTLNDDQVVDATRKGNLAKFINHNKKNPNCAVKILQVNGDHRIGIFAKRDIKDGEELTFDYNYHTQAAPEWAGNVSGKGKKGSGKKHANRKQ